MFNKDTGKLFKDIQIPDFLYNLTLTEWVPSDRMTDQEKKDHPEYETTQGYLKSYSYKKAWANLWKSLTQDQINQVKQLPNFDEAVFEEITGIRINSNLSNKKAELLSKADELMLKVEELRKQAEDF